MNNNQVVKGMIDGNKALLDDAFTNLAALQDRTNNHIAKVLEITPCISREAKQSSLDLETRYKESYKKVFDYLVQREKEAT